MEEENSEWVTTYEAVSLVKHSERWLYNHSYTTEIKRNELAARGVHPLFRRYKLGRENRYKKSDLFEFARE